MNAVTSTADATRLAGGSNSVTSPVPAGTATVGQAERTAETPPVSSSSPLPAQADSNAAIATAPHILTPTRLHSITMAAP